MKTLNGVPFSEYVTLTGDHTCNGSVTWSDGAATPRIVAQGTVNGRIYENDFMHRNTKQNITGL